MITATHRFHGRNSLRYVYQRGKTVRGADLSLRYVFNDRCKAYRVAVVVSRKVSKSAVVRNRIRRRVYEIVRKNSTQITDPYDLIFTIYDQTAATRPHEELSKSVLGCLERATVLQKTPHDRGGRVIVNSKETKD